MLTFREAINILGPYLPSINNRALEQFAIRTEYKPYKSKRQGTKYFAVYNKQDVLKVKEILKRKNSDEI